VARSFEHGSKNSVPRKRGLHIEQLRHFRASEVTEYNLEVVN
jgi:hypothetical protein